MQCMNAGFYTGPIKTINDLEHIMHEDRIRLPALMDKVMTAVSYTHLTLPTICSV